METLKDIEEKQTALKEKIQKLFQNPKRTKKDMESLYKEIEEFEKERASILYKDFFKEMK
jgi:uncharacterized coiled-coil DUF342 family protein